MERLLEKRTRYFFSSRYRGRAGVHSTLHDLEEMGQVVLIGGMLRDLALFGNAQFRSDLDFVIDPRDPDLFHEHMSFIGAKENRFGGYSLPSNKWQVDVWPLQKTWAHSAGHVTVKTFGDLRKVTFFDCDAIIYDVSKKKISAKAGYFERLRQRVLDVNLRPNPNPAGNAVRAFRYALLKGFLWAPDLTQFVAETLEDVGWQGLIERESRSFRSRYIEQLDQHALERQLCEYLSQKTTGNFSPAKYQRNVQLELPFLH